MSSTPGVVSGASAVQTDPLQVLPLDLLLDAAPLRMAAPTRALTPLYTLIERFRYDEVALSLLLSQLTTPLLQNIPSSTSGSAEKTELLFHACTGLLYQLKSKLHRFDTEQQTYIHDTAASICTKHAAPTIPASSPQAVDSAWGSPPHSFVIPLPSLTDTDPSISVLRAYTKSNGTFCTLAGDADRLGILMSDSDGILNHHHFGQLFR